MPSLLDAPGRSDVKKVRLECLESGEQGHVDLCCRNEVAAFDTMSIGWSRSARSIECVVDRFSILRK